MKSRRPERPQAVDESTESEITIGPDGRVFAFGITRGLAAVLATIPTSDERMTNLLEKIGGLDTSRGRVQPAQTEETP